MFGIKAPLMDKAGEESGVGKVVNAAADAMASLSTNKPEEGTDPTKTKALDEPLLRGEKHTAAAGFTPAGTDKPVTQGKATMRLKGEYSPQLPSDIQDERQLIRQKELNFAEAQAFTTLNAGRALAQTKAQAQEIAATDFAEMERLNKEHYSRWETENEQLRADIDAARQLRVNPNNYYQSIGRSGRVASVLSVAVSQLAAGAGNPNMVWNRLKSTIEQDITAQKNNIELEFAGIEAAQGQQKHEAAMLEKYYGFEEKSRAVGYAALEAQIGVIQQRAQNEMEYQAYQMIRDRARAEQIDAAAAALAKNATLYLDAPTHRAYQALINARKWQEAQAYLQAAYSQQLGGAQDVDTSIESFDQYGQPVTFADPAPAAPLGEVTQGPAPTLPGEAPRTAAPGRKRTRPTTGVEEAPVVAEAEPSPAEQPAAARPETPVEAEAAAALDGSPQYTPEEQAEVDAIRAETERREGIRATTEDVKRSMGTRIWNEGGYAFSRAKAEGRRPRPGTKTFQEAASVIVDPENNEIAVFASYDDAREGVKYDTRTGERAKYEKDRAELYEAKFRQVHEGTASNPRWVEQNYVTSAWGDLKLTEGSIYRDDENARKELRTDINTDFRRAEGLYNQARAVTEYGTGQLFGFQFGKDGITWIGTDGGEAMSERLSGQIELGIQAMKLMDPSGRLTDKDIDVGMQVVTAMLQSPTVKVWDVMNAAWTRVFGKDNNPTKSDMRRVINKTLKKMASKLSDAVAKKYIGDIVMSYDQHKQFSTGRDNVNQWITTEEVEEEPSKADVGNIKATTGHSPNRAAGRK